MKEQILEIYNEVMKQILLVAQSSLSESQFTAFRKIVLDRYGEAQRKVNKLLEKERVGMQ
ncbi:MAG: hypothetical protein ABH844_03015 [Candidatus Omnitrophota bacterium]